MLNEITIHGRLTANPELRTTPNGVPVCAVTVAVDRSYAKKSEEKQTDFFAVVFWRGLADMVVKYFTKGKEILISGEMQSRKWKDNDGNNRVDWEVIANKVDFCGKNEKNNDLTASGDTKNVNSADFNSSEPSDYEDLPF